MKKTLVALAAFAAASAFAQSSVTVFGVMDVGPNVKKVTDAEGATTKTTAANASGAWASNRLGFKGTEDLGGGLKADFWYELGLGASVDGALGVSEARQSWAGVSGGFGSVAVGRQYNPAFSVNASLDAGAANNLAYGRTVYGANGGSGATGAITTARTNGLVTYTSPTIAGVTAKLSQSTIKTNTTADGDAGDSVTGGSLVYANGPLMAAYGFNKVNKLGATAGDRDESIFGATYAVGKATVLASVGSAKTKDDAGAQSGKKTATQVGIRYPFGAVDTFLSYGTQKTNAEAGSEDVKSKGYQAGGIYNLSKRTGVYAAYGQNKTTDTSIKGSELALGVRHSF